jgi:hypothetical protein
MPATESGPTAITSASRAETTLRNAVQNLSIRFQKLGNGSELNFHAIDDGYDINTLADTMECSLESLISKIDVPQSHQNQVKDFVVKWAQKCIPFGRGLVVPIVPVRDG